MANIYLDNAYYAFGFYCMGGLQTSLDEVLLSYTQEELIAPLKERVMCYLLSEADKTDGSIQYGHSEHVAKIFFPDDPDAHIPDIKKILLTLYKSRFIRQHKGEIYLAQHIIVMRGYGHHGIMRINVFYKNVDGNFGMLDLPELYYENSDFPHTVPGGTALDMDKVNPVNMTVMCQLLYGLWCDSLSKKKSLYKITTKQIIDKNPKLVKELLENRFIIPCSTSVNKNGYSLNGTILVEFCAFLKEYCVICPIFKNK